MRSAASATEKMEKTINGKKIAAAAFRVLLIFGGSALVLEALAAISLTAKTNLGIIMPLVIGAPLVLCGLFYGSIGRLSAKYPFVKFLKNCMIAVYALFFALFIFTTTVILINSAEPTDKKPDTIIVLGAGIRGSIPSATLAYRLDKAIEYYNADRSLTIVVSGGRGSDEAFTEAEVMARYLMQSGVDGDNIIIEDRSTSTEENFMFSRELIGEGHTLAFVTTRFHVFRAERIAKKLGVDAFGIPARGYKPLTLNDYMRECAAIVQYFFTGRL